jgi:xanthine/CO dehydrogenase XdhC/CoxF family maturation factor
VLGPKKKLNRLLDEIKGKGLKITDDEINNIYGPAGLAVGAENSEEIALSIIAEIQAVLQKTSGSPLREKEFIHQRNPEMVINAAVSTTTINTCAV